ncbi:MAG: Asp-tRNA(Asn)/Glu-tRNA(Gln) amidotransferase subunit GatC [Tissierellaceae bacterium]|nr:Asp-tRNA(Asn)/Glu-tRNA(Gln) amidotransferase subunit GatC [Tissierellaceae bacterium]
MISKEDVSQIADLCKLDFNDVESDEFIGEFERVLNLVEKIKELDTEGVEPTYHVNNYKEPFIGDDVKESLPQKDVLKNTVEEKYGYFKILKVVD